MGFARPAPGNPSAWRVQRPASRRSECRVGTFGRNESEPEQPSYDRLVLAPREPRLLLDGGPVISEFMALNNSGYTDGDGQHVDWIELYNPTASPIELGGWYLSDKADDLTKWEFPAYHRASGGVLL